MINRPLLVVWLVLTFAVALSAALPRQDPVANAKKAVAAAEAQLAKATRDQDLGTSGPSSLIQARIALAEAKIDLAEAEHKDNAVPAPLGELVGFREQALKLAERAYEVGAGSRAEVVSAQLAASQARALVELHRMLMLRLTQVHFVKERVAVGDAELVELTAALDAVARARAAWNLIRKG